MGPSHTAGTPICTILCRRSNIGCAAELFSMHSAKKMNRQFAKANSNAENTRIKFPRLQILLPKLEGS